MHSGFATAYLLHSKAFQDDKLLLDLLLPELGRLRVVARRPSKKQTGRSQWPLFTELLVQLTGRAELKTAKSIEETTIRWPLQGEFLFSGLYLNELICRVWPQDTGSEQLFYLYQQCLKSLAVHQGQAQLLQPVLRQFELQLLTELGQPVDFQFDAEGQPLSAYAYYQWQSEYGFVPALRGWTGADLLAIGAAAWSAPVQRTAKLLCRHLLQPYLGSKPLLSRALFSKEL